MIVTGHDAIQHRVLTLSAGIGMVVDHIHHYAQPTLVEGLHHFTEFDDARRAVWVGGITTFRRGVMQWIVTPVESIRAGDGADRNRLSIRVRWKGSKLAFIHRLPCGFIFVHAGDIESRQEMNVSQASLRQSAEMLHPIRVFDGERFVGAAQFLRNGLVADAEIADVQLIEDNIFGRGEHWLFEGIPILRFEIRIVQVHDLAELAVHRKTERIWIGHQIGFDASLSTARRLPPHIDNTDPSNLLLR